MGITGRYDFKGIQKAMSVGINALIASTAWGAWLLASPFRFALQALEDAAVNYFANRGLILIDVGAITTDGKVDQTKLDAALTAGIARVQQGRDKITPEEGAKIDAEVIQAFDADADLGINSVPNVSNPSV